MKEERSLDSERKFARVFLFFLAACCFIICLAGSANTYFLQTRGIKTEAQVLEIVVDQKYRTTNWKRSEDYYKVKLQFVNQEGANQIQWGRVDLKDKERLGLAVGAQVPFIYIPGSDRSLVDKEPPSWNEAIISNALFMSIGLVFIGMGILKK